MADARVSGKGQIVIAAHIRERYGIRPGTRICFIEREQEVVVQPLTKESVRKACGMLKSRSSATGELLKERARARRRIQSFELSNRT